MPSTTCRFCAANVTTSFADLGMSPIANDYLSGDQVNGMEPFYPLRALVCDQCFLVQLEDFETPEAIFADDYAYFSSYSTSWLEHCRRYVGHAVERFGLGPESKVVEVASNDGYLLQYFKERDIPVLGIEPAASVAQAAQLKGVPTVQRFFGVETANDLVGEAEADLLIGNNVLAHVPDLNDFVAGMQVMLKPHGVITMEFPHLQQLIEHVQFDTIYHEHFSYFSFLTVERVFAANGLVIFDVEELPTHGGSLRIYGRRADSDHEPVTDRVTDLGARERAAGYAELDIYRAFAERVKATKREVLRFFIDAKEAGASIAGYGAPAKGNTLLNYCGIGADLLDYTVDLSPHKQGKFLPGTHIPILAPEEIARTRPDYLFILPWNLRDEIIDQMSHVRDWGGRFVVRTPEFEVIE
jgi:2-polyprenyl-3-methyl-5-hydroxy-6-metoxy-1,4-benzoquinol methylase